MAAPGENSGNGRGGVSEDKELLDRLQELESQAAFQEELQSQLSDVVSRQDREIAELRAQVLELARQLKEIGEPLQGDAGSGEEPPPHY